MRGPESPKRFYKEEESGEVSPPHVKTSYGCMMLAEGEPHRRAEQKNPEMDPGEFSRLASENRAGAGDTLGRGAGPSVAVGNDADFELNLVLCAKRLTQKNGS